MEENVFYVSSWHTWSCECSELVLTFSQTFCLKTNARSHSVPPLLNCQILLTSLFPEECKCILSLHAAAEFLQLANVSSSPRFPAGVPRPGWMQAVSLPCARGWHCKPAELFGAARPGGGPVLPIPCGIRAGELGHLAGGTLAFPLCGLHQSPWKRVQHHPNPWGHLLVGTPCLVLMAASFGWWLPRPTRFYLESSIFCKSESTPALPHLLLPRALLVKLFPAFLPQNNLFCRPHAWG